MSKEKRLTISHLIQNLNIKLRIKRDNKLPSNCICLFRLCDNFKSTDPCPVHHDESRNNGLVTIVLNNFIEKNILYINTPDYNDIIYEYRIQMMLPLVLHMYTTGPCGVFHFHDKNVPLKLNHPCVQFINLVIINFAKCTRKKCIHNTYNKLVSKTKIINFKYLILFNYNKTITPPINKHRLPTCLEKNKSSFELKLGDFLQHL